MRKKPWENMDFVRFNKEFGPKSLFDRVEFKMKDVHELFMDGEHFKTRVEERDIPDEVMNRIKNFDINEWTLRTAEVRKDRGKFYNSTWELEYNGEYYWLTIGLGQYVKTIVRKTSSGVEKCIKTGEYYDFVEKVNRDLMNAEADIIV